MRDQVANFQNIVTSIRYWHEFGNPYNYPDYLNWSYNPSGSTLLEWRGRSDITQGDGESPTYYRAYDLKVDPVPFNYVEYSAWKWQWVFPPGVPSPGRMWRRIRKEYYGSGFISDAYTRQGIDPAGFPLVPNSLKSEARTKCLNQLIESEVNLGQTAGEARETLGFVSEHIARGVLAIRLIKKRKYRQAARVLRIPFNKKEMADNLLAYQFGLLPLMNDIYNGVDAIRKAQIKSDTVKVKSVAMDKAAFPLLIPYSFDGSLERGCEASYTYKLDDHRLATLSTLGLTNPISLAWELLPSSYIVDWFLSIGDVLSALGADLGYSYLGGYETEFVRGDFTISSNSWAGGHLGPQTWTVKSFAMERNVAPPPKPGLYIKSGLNLGKALTSIALLEKRS